LSQSTPGTSPEKEKLPDWATQPFERFLNQSERLGHVVRLSVHGISGLLGVPRLVEVLAKVQGKNDTETHAKRLANAREEADLAKREIDTGFPILYSNAIVALWSLLEAMLRANVVAWLKNEPRSLEVETIAKLRVRLREYEKLVQDDRFHYIAELLEGELAAGLRNGVERFEAMLKPFTLDGAVPDKLRRDMFKFGQIRNAIAHRGGHADRQLLSACPWLGLIASQELPIGRDHFARYVKAAHSYVILLICRVGEHFGQEMIEHRQSILSDYDAA